MHEYALLHSEISYSCLKTARAEALSCILKIVSKQNERHLGSASTIPQVQNEYLHIVDVVHANKLERVPVAVFSWKPCLFDSS